MRAQANPIRSTVAHVMHDIANGRLPAGSRITRQNLYHYGNQLHHRDMNLIEGMLLRPGVGVLHRVLGGYVVKQDAASMIKNSPELNWLQLNHDRLSRSLGTGLPSTLEQSKTLEVLKTIEANTEITPSSLQNLLAHEGITLSDYRSRRMLQWLKNESYITQQGQRYISSAEGSAQAEQSLDVFEAAKKPAVSSTQRRKEPMIYGGAGRNAGSDSRRVYLHQMTHGRFSQLLSDIYRQKKIAGEELNVTEVNRHFFNNLQGKAVNKEELHDASRSFKNWAHRKGLISNRGDRCLISENAQEIILTNPDLLWRAQNQTRLSKSVNDHRMPGSRIHQALLEYIASGGIKNGQGFPSSRSIMGQFQANAQAFSTNHAAELIAWLRSLSILEKVNNSSSGHRVSPTGQQMAHHLLDVFKGLDPDSPLEPCHVEATQHLQVPEQAAPSFEQKLPKHQRLLGLFAHLLVKLNQGSINQTTGLPTSIQSLQKHGLPGEPLNPNHIHLLTQTNIIQPRTTFSTRDYVSLLPGSDEKIKGHPRLRWLANNANGLSNTINELTPLNEIEYAVLEMISGRKYRDKSQSKLIDQKQMSLRASSEIWDNSRHSGMNTAFRKYRTLGLIRTEGTSRNQRHYLVDGLAQTKALECLKQFDKASRQETSQRNSLPPSVSEASPPIADHLSQAVAASLLDNRNERSTTAAQNAQLPRGYVWHNPAPDGNCLFHALSRAFPDLGDHQQIRQQVALAAERRTELGPNIRREFRQAIGQASEYTRMADRTSGGI